VFVPNTGRKKAEPYPSSPISVVGLVIGFQVDSDGSCYQALLHKRVNAAL